MRFTILDYEKMFDPERLITNHNPLTKDKKFSPDGLFSEELFGKKIDNEHLSYQCKCGKNKGKFLEGYFCKECESKVQYTKPMLDKLAWISLGDYYIIHPLFYYLINTLSGPTAKVLNNIIKYEPTTDRDGNVIEDDKSFPYENIGLVEFKENFDEIFDYLYNKSNNKDKDKIWQIVQKYRKLIFINKIPVFSTNLRQATMTFKDKVIFKFDEINDSLNFIIKNSNMINAEKNKDFTLAILPNLYTIQVKANMVHDKIIENLSGKYGFIRSNQVGNRLNFSARNVITPLKPEIAIDEVILPYRTFIELYNYHIINVLCNVKKINYIQAQNIVNEAQATFNEEVFNICKDIIKKTKGRCKVLINRNPSISYGSILCVNIADIKSDIKDLTMSIHNCVLELLAGDYDGDVLNIIPLFEPVYKDIFSKVFSPAFMFISNNDGRFNTALSLDRDQVLGIHALNM